MKTMLRTALVLILCLPATAYAAEIPDTRAGRALTAWLAVLESNDEAKFREHHERALAPTFKEAVPVEHYVRVCGQLRGLLSEGIAHVESEGDHNLTAWVKSPSGWLEILLQVDATLPHPIVGLLARPGGPPPEGGNDETKSEFPESGTLGEMLDHTRAVTGIPGIAAAHLVNGEIREVAVSGVRDLESNEAVEKGDRFHIGSVTKSFTATMIGALIETGKLDWETTVGEVLDDIEMLDAYRPVTLRQLMQHQAGVIPATGFDDEGMARWTGQKGGETAHRAGFAAHVLKQEPVGKPGGEMIYSNAGYMLAALMAERRTGKSWSKLMSSRVFEPLELESVGFGWPRTEKRTDQPRGHQPGEDGLAMVDEADYALGHFLAPAGDLHMSVADLARYGQAHLAGLNGTDGVLESATFRRLHTPPDGEQYACGWLVFDVDGQPMHWHNGSAGTFYTMLALFPETGEVFAFTSNAAPRAEEFAQKIGGILHERNPVAAD